MPEFDLLRALPKTKRNIAKRRDGKDPSVVATAKQFGEMYFDGPREYGYGGYRYDGRWVPVARDIVSRFDLKAGMRVLDVGCAKGFPCQGPDDRVSRARGLRSRYLLLCADALRPGHGRPAASRNNGTFAVSGPSFDAVISINTVHNLDRQGCTRALQEMVRVVRDPAKCFVQVDAYRSEEEKALFESWCLTAETYLRPAEWVALFQQAGYSGDYYWTILES